MIDRLRAEVAEIEQLCSNNSLNHLRYYIESLDFLEAYLDDELIFQSDAEIGLYNRIRILYKNLQANIQFNCQFFRQEIKQGIGSHQLIQWISDNDNDEDQKSGEGYDYLDILINSILQLTPPKGKIAELPAGMVHYQPTPARHIFDLISHITLGKQDVLVDLGSGMGHIPLLVAICTEANSIGIEVEKAYVDCAWQCAQDLCLTNVTFIHQDARMADLSQGTLFYLYTPFTSTILLDVLNLLRYEARRREIRICTFGPCTMTVARESWLEPERPIQSDRIVLFHCRN
jgi:hypothetical protein